MVVNHFRALVHHLGGGFIVVTVEGQVIPAKGVPEPIVGPMLNACCGSKKSIATVISKAENGSISVLGKVKKGVSKTSPDIAIHRGVCC